MPAETVGVPLGPPSVYGKLPARGDFITRGFDRTVIDAWDGWLREAILASRDALGERWLEIYLSSPIWRFALGAGNCGPNTVIGVLMPSVDKVGRYYPLMVGRELAPGIELTRLIANASAWYQAIEDLALSTLAPEFQLEMLEVPLPFDADATAIAPEASSPLAAPGLCIPFGSDIGGVELRRAHQPLARGRNLWWTSGSEHVVPCLLICPEMPLAKSFVSMLDGDWTRGGWLGPPVEAMAGASEVTASSDEETAELTEPRTADAATESRSAGEIDDASGHGSAKPRADTGSTCGGAAS